MYINEFCITGPVERLKAFRQELIEVYKIPIAYNFDNREICILINYQGCLGKHLCNQNTIGTCLRYPQNRKRILRLIKGEEKL